MAGSSSSDYTYLQIKDTRKLINMKVNLCARISEVGLPEKSRGSDYCLVLKIVDFSCPTAAHSVNIFLPHKENLPSIKSVGDVICLHQVVVKIHNKDFYFLFNKKFSSFGLYHGDTKMGTDPYQNSANYYTTDCTNESIVKLRALPLEQSDASSYSKTVQGDKSTLSLLRDIGAGKVFDLICKILYVSKTSEDGRMLFVWDGTDTPPATFQSDLDLEKENPTPLNPESSLLPKEILFSFPCTGTVLRVKTEKIFEDIQGKNHWIKLYNVYCGRHSDLWTGLMKDSSRVFFLSDENGNVKRRKQLYSERVESDIERMPMTSLLVNWFPTETDYRNAPFATLMDSITNSQVPNKIKSVVRVVASCPWRGEHLRSPNNGHYRVRLTLEDHTARIHAYLVEEEAVKFFGGILEPDALDNKMKRLLGIEDQPSVESLSIATRNPPWIKCCLASYYLEENDKYGSRRYRIFGTWLKSN